jgi:adenosylcobinamide-phosphate synthase
MVTRLPGHGRPSRTAWAAAASAGLALDRLIGDPPDRLHPVAWFGTAMAGAERMWWSDDRSRGAAHALVGVGGAALAGGLLRRAGRLAGPAAETAVAVALAATVIGARSLDLRAGEIGSALAAGRIEEARRLLPALVGRDPAGLDQAEIARAVVESLAENSVDAVVAPLLWAATAGPAGAAAYRAVNTLDAMVGHRSDRYRRFGWASARLDDIANYLPARLAAAVIAVLEPRRAPALARAVITQAPSHPSPNAGVIEAAFAAALDLRLGGNNSYGGLSEPRARLGDGRGAEAADIDRARRLAARLHWSVAAALAAPMAARLAGRLIGRRR